MKVTFLGTGTSQGIPIIACDCEVCRSADEKDHRLRSSVMIEDEGTTIVIDTGPDFRYQMLREGVKKLDAVVFTHAHRDHTAGLDDIRAFNYIQKKDMDIYVDQNTLDTLKSQFDYIFAPSPYPGIPKINIHMIEDRPFRVQNMELTPIEVKHYKLPVLGFRIKGFTYITDANYISEQEMEKIYGSEVLVLNALRKSTHISHFNLEEAIDLVNRVKPRQAYFTHISHQLGKHRDISPELPENVFLAYDRLQIEL